jgi:hypothetical protein
LSKAGLVEVLYDFDTFSTLITRSQSRRYRTVTKWSDARRHPPRGGVTDVVGTDDVVGGVPVAAGGNGLGIPNGSVGVVVGIRLVAVGAVCSGVGSGVVSVVVSVSDGSSVVYSVVAGGYMVSGAGASRVGTTAGATGP